MPGTPFLDSEEVESPYYMLMASAVFSQPQAWDITGRAPAMLRFPGGQPGLAVPCLHDDWTKSATPPTVDRSKPVLLVLSGGRAAVGDIRALLACACVACLSALLCLSRHGAWELRWDAESLCSEYWAGVRFIVLPETSRSVVLYGVATVCVVPVAALQLDLKSACMVLKIFADVAVFLGFLVTSPPVLSRFQDLLVVAALWSTSFFCRRIERCWGRDFVVWPAHE